MVRSKRSDFIGRSQEKEGNAISNGRDFNLPDDFDIVPEAWIDSSNNLHKGFNPNSFDRGNYSRIERIIFSVEDKNGKEIGHRTVWLEDWEYGAWDELYEIIYDWFESEYGSAQG